MPPYRNKDALSKSELDRQLHDVLKMTFPGSDPISIGQPVGPILARRRNSPKRTRVDHKDRNQDGDRRPTKSAKPK